MGLFIQQNDKRSQLQERLAAELREKAATSVGGTEPLNVTKNSNYLKDTETASRPSFLLIGVAIAFIAAFFLFLMGL